MRRLVVILISGFAVASFFLSVLLIYKTHDQIARGYGDFIIYYTGAQILRDAPGSSLYDLSVQKEYQRRLNVPNRPEPLPYNHPPFELFWHLPLSYLSYAHAFIIWFLANVVFLVILYLIWGAHKNASSAPMFFFMIMGFFPVAAALMQGQDSILLCLLLSSGFIMLGRGSQTVAGILFAFSLIKPQFSIPAIIVMVMRPYSLAIRAFLVTAALLATASAAILGNEGIARYITMMHNLDAIPPKVFPPAMPNVRGLIFTVFHAWNAEVVFPITAAITLAIIVLLAVSWQRAGKHPLPAHLFELRVAYTMILGVLISYHCYIHDLSLFLCSCVLIARHLLNQKKSWSLNHWFLICTLLIFFFPFPFTFGLLIINDGLAWGSLLLIFCAIILGIEIRREDRFLAQSHRPDDACSASS